ncbi:Retrovirus-related Pol polyprotein from transposon RE1, partial [Bienertia sinuspersici]
KSGAHFYCTHYKILGHSVDRCFNLHGYPPRFKGFKDKKKQQTSSNAHCGTQFGALKDRSQALIAGQYYLITNNNLQWLLDSEASNHICCDLSYFKSYKSCTKPYSSIVIAKGSKVFVSHIGSTKLTAYITLYNVLHVPGFKSNLISVHKLCRDLNYELLFTSDT